VTSIITYCMFAFLLQQAPTAKTSLALVDMDPPVLKPDQNGVATATLTIRVDKPSPTSPSPRGTLTLSDFQHEKLDRTMYRLFTTATFTAVKPADPKILIGELPLPDEPITVRLTVANLWEAGFSTARLKFGDTDIAGSNQVQALRIPTAFNIQIQSETPSHPEILISPQHRPIVRLVNSDALTHRLRWQLGSSDEARLIEVPANGFVDIQVTQAPKPTLLAAGTLRDRVARSEIILTPEFGGAPTAPLQSKVLPVWFRLRYWGDGLQEVMNILSVVLLLTIGGVLSIWVHCGMPNTARALAVRRRLKAADMRVRALGTDVDSRWRVLLTCRIRKFWGELYSTWWVFPSFAAVLDQLNKEIENFEQWLQCAQSVGLTLQGVRESLPQGFPPTVLELIEANCRTALEPIESGMTTPEQVQMMKSSAQAAADLLDSVTNRKAIPELEKTIIDREAKLRPVATALSVAVPEFGALVLQVSNAPTTITPDQYIDRDMSSRKAELLNEFRELRERITVAARAAAVGNPAAAGAPPAAVRFSEHTDRFLEYIRPEAPRSLQRAELFLLEMKEDIYSPALLAEAKKTPPGIDIVAVPDIADLSLPVLFRLRYKRDALNEAAASREWRYIWQFGDGSEECGSTAFHKFEAAGEYPVKVSIFSNETADAIVTLPPKPLKVVDLANQKSKSRWGFLSAVPRLLGWFSPETKLEFSRLLLVLAAAVIGLIGVAQQRIDSLSLPQSIFAIAALGFGADTLKNMITKGSNQ
jgi:hypothetical protein